jgi:hypothetical protein
MTEELLKCLNTALMHRGISFLHFSVSLSQETFDPEDDDREGGEMRPFASLATRSLVFLLVASALQREEAKALDRRPHTCKYLCPRLTTWFP